ncbi:DUF1707 SHOCT-like domain-containing protein [Jidongwangia harbinensis]|uniref:DUF1707 SHOCT-like domain-containing protein n=1 Tax=Jidongwangia harbinensis TaxID=2878561 RepID=UPI001CD9FD72|nr:DUF1707 domain-containing protein [Jidongwangia harbinensis]MCA2213015.1 DUF1707 domain-containing protein [Jidongwangia harbinensis]
MAKEVAKPGAQGDPVDLRASDADRQQIADRLQAALDEGRLSLHEYDDRVKETYAARTYAELLHLVSDLPQPGLSAADVNARRIAEVKRAARRMPTALMVLWTIWGALAVINLVVWVLVAMTVDGYVYPWPVWTLVPGAALATVTVGVQMIRTRKAT